jgi:hypothetical protein
MDRGIHKLDAEFEEVVPRVLLTVNPYDLGFDGFPGQAWIDEFPAFQQRPVSQPTDGLSRDLDAASIRSQIGDRDVAVRMTSNLEPGPAPGFKVSARMEPFVHV